MHRVCLGYIVRRNIYCLASSKQLCRQNQLSMSCEVPLFYLAGKLLKLFSGKFFIGQYIRMPTKTKQNPPILIKICYNIIRFIVEGKVPKNE